MPGGGEVFVMSHSMNDAGTKPAVVEVAPVQAPVKYETGKGCLMFVLIGLVLLALTVGAILLFGDPTGVGG